MFWKLGKYQLKFNPKTSANIILSKETNKQTNNIFYHLKNYFLHKTQSFISISKRKPHLHYNYFILLNKLFTKKSL